MPRYSPEDKDRIYREWLRLERPPMYTFQNYFREQLENKNPDFAWLEAPPTDISLSAWKEEYKWEKRAEKEQELIRNALSQDAVELKHSMFQKLKESALLKMGIQQDVFIAAKIEDLSPKEARHLLGEAQEIGRSGIRDMEEALRLVGEAINSEEGKKPELAELFGALEGVLGGELKAAMAIQLKSGQHLKKTAKEENVDIDIIEGEVKELEN